jgi:hypothetical protein
VDAVNRHRAVTAVQAILVVNALPAFVNLMSIPDRTERWFVWTVKPDANARTLGVMYGSACLLGLLGYWARTWPRQRATFVVVAPFAVAATIVTLVTLKPFRAHPWYELAYWLLMYSILFVLVPITFLANERAEGGRLPVEAPFAAAARAGVAALGALLLVAGIGLLFELSYATRLWPFAITPLVARILGVWLGCLGLAHLWAAWDGDRLRGRALLLSMPPAGALLALVPLLHRDDLRDGPTGALVAYLAVAGAMTVLPLVALAQPRARPGPRRAGDAAAASPPPFSL